MAKYVRYQTALRKKIIKNWKLPEKYLGRLGELTARFILKIDEQGRIISIEEELASGEPDFDKSCLKAIKSASPFSKPLQKFVAEASNEGFLIEFAPGKDADRSADVEKVKQLLKEKAVKSDL